MKSKQILLGLLLIYYLSGASANSHNKIRASTSTSKEQASNGTSIVSAAEATNSQRQQSGNSSLSNDESPGSLHDDEDDNGLMSGSASALSSAVNYDSEPSSRTIAIKHDEDQATSPTMASVHHQVWTSSTSGSLDELSPEMISKLRADVPFLAAYALRPRLVGASSLSSDHRLSNSNRLIEANLQTSASQQQRQASFPQSEVAAPKLSDFSELKVETSSTSKSEHHHKRKTTLKKQPTVGDSSKKRRLILATASRLMIERGRKNDAKRRSGGKSFSSSRKLNSGKRLSSKASGRLRSQAGRLRRKLNRNNRRHHMSIIRHGRQQQQTSGSVSPALNELPGSKTNSVQDDDAGEVKGGPKKAVEPFYKRSKGAERKSVADEQPTNDLGDDDEPKKPDSSAGRETPVEDNEEAQLDPPEPRRVGEPDVDEVEGDTVTVMPKFDGVDDDPEVPIEDSEQPTADRDDDDTNPREREDGLLSPKESEGDEPRGKRVNREKSESGGDATVAGAGIGTTTGGTGDAAGREENIGSGRDGADAHTGGEKSSRPEPGVEFADKDQGASDENDDDDPKEPASSGTRTSNGAHDGEGGEPMGERPFDSRRVASDTGAGAGAGSSGRGRDNTGRSGTDRGSKGMKKDHAGDDDDDSRAEDVDYRDDDKETNSGKRNDRGRESTKSPEDSDGGQHDGKVVIDDQEKSMAKGQHGRRLDCDHHDDHHHEHHSHHDGIKWLQDAIPGQPGQDYPILNRNNLTDFNCRDQKYAGYYADVETRCQVFHICQADGRQDSFLCPNGTIFSQISRVCVWWNSFDCEDAPKFYALNAQLYSNTKSNNNDNNKHATAHQSAPDLRPLDGARINPNDGTVNADDDDEESSIGSLIKAMRRRQMMGSMEDRSSLGGDDDDAMAALDEDDAQGARREGVMMSEPRLGGAGGRAREGAEGRSGSKGLSAEDEASIQRKSTKLATADEEEDEKAQGSNGAASSRLRHNEPRRKRRASVRQAPPKLKSRRVSRRRKLRHGIKPKRRA